MGSRGRSEEREMGGERVGGRREGGGGGGEREGGGSEEGKKVRPLAIGLGVSIGQY
jgi:hypothetical protein